MDNRNKVALVTGASSGLGQSISAALARQGFSVIPYDLSEGHDVCSPDLDVMKEHNQLDVLVNCAGVNRINWLENVEEEDWDAMLGTNAKGIFKMTQAFLPWLKRSKGTVLNIVSNAAHMPMRCSAAYNASKGAALILTKQLARELAPDITVFSVSPNKLSGTAMSDAIDRQVVATRGWTIEQAQEYQCAGLLAGEETPPELVADMIGFLLSDKMRHKYLAGCDIPYGA